MNETSISDRLKSELDAKRQELAHCLRIIEAMIDTYDQAAEAATRRDHLLGIRQADVDYLWAEIAKLQEGLEQAARGRSELEARLQEISAHAQALEQLALQAGVAPEQLPGLPDRKPLQSFGAARFSGAKVPMPMGVERQFFCGLDTPPSGLRREGSGMVHLGGWCCDGSGQPARRVWVAVDQREIPCTLGWKRMDVVKEFEGQLRVVPHCGFNVEIETLPGANFLRVWAEFASGARHCLMHRTIVRADASDTPSVGQLDQPYDAWVELFDTPTRSQIATMQCRIREMVEPPLISVLLPTYNTEERWLAQAIESVRRQSYPHWQLCIADDASPKPHVRAMLEHYARLDSRIAITIREQNGHISAATNSALALAKGTFCALLDHDDMLPPHALYHVARCIEANPDVNLIYSDEDKIDEFGERFDPYFKSDWNPELFLSHNCISHLGVYRSAILREIGGFDASLSGSQDWDMALRFIARAGERGICHIPRILYHWRYLDSSTSKSIESKPYAITAGKRAIENFLAARNDRSIVHPGSWPGSFRVQPALERAPTVSVILLDLVPTETDVCIAALRADTDGALFEFIRVDGSEQGAQDASKDAFRLHAVRRVGGLDRGNHAASYNHGARHANGELLVLLSAQARPAHREWLQELCAQVCKKDAGVAGPWLQHADATTFSAGMIVTSACSGVLHAFRGLSSRDIGHMGRAHLVQRYLAVAPQCLVTRRAVFEALGGLDAKHFPKHRWNVDYCLRVRFDAGRFTVWSPYSKVTIFDRFELGGDALGEQGRLAEHWGPIVPEDPFFNPNLDENDSRFFLAWPPRSLG